MTTTPSNALQFGALLLDGWIEEGAHNYLLRVQYEDTDLGGIIYRNYLNLPSGPAQLFALSWHLPGGEFDGRVGGHAFVVRRAEIDFRKVAGLGLFCASSPRLPSFRGETDTGTNHKNRQSGLILAEVVVDMVYVGINGRDEVVPTRMPNKIINRLTRNHQDHNEK